MKRHTSCTHVNDSNNEVNRTQNRRNTGKVKAEDTEINSRAGVSFDTAKRGVDSSTSTGTNFNERRKKK
jgi:hypothetical protein